MSDGVSGQRPNSGDEFSRWVRRLTEATADDRARQARRRARRARMQAWTRVGLAIVLAAVGTFAWLHLRHPSTVSAGLSIAPMIASSAPTIASSAPTITDAPPVLPFAGTPAQTWADGAAGIVVPAAKPVGSFTAEQVAAAYQQAETC